MLLGHVSPLAALGRKTSRGKEQNTSFIGGSETLLESRENTESVYDMPNDVKTANSFI